MRPPVSPADPGGLFARRIPAPANRQRSCQRGLDDPDLIDGLDKNRSDRREEQRRDEEPLTRPSADPGAHERPRADCQQHRESRLAEKVREPQKHEGGPRARLKEPERDRREQRHQVRQPGLRPGPQLHATKGSRQRQEERRDHERGRNLSTRAPAPKQKFHGCDKFYAGMTGDNSVTAMEPVFRNGSRRS
jgi:hypothetical protein